MKTFQCKLILVAALLVFAGQSQMFGMQVKQRNKEAIMKHVNSMLKDMKKAKTVNDAKLYDGYLKGYMKEQKKKDMKRKRSVRQTPGFLTSQEKKVTQQTGTTVKRLQDKAKKAVEKISLKKIENAGDFDDLLDEYKNYMRELGKHRESLSTEERQKFQEKAENTVLETANKMKETIITEIEQDKEKTLDKINKAKSSDKVKKIWDDYEMEVYFEEALDRFLFEKKKFKKIYEDIKKVEVETIDEVFGALEKQFSKTELDNAQKESIADSKEVLREVTNRLSDIKNIPKKEKDKFVQEIKESKTELLAIKTGDNAAEAKKILTELDTADNKLTTRYNRVVILMDDLPKIFTQNPDQSVEDNLFSAQMAQKNITNNPEQKEFWGKIYKTEDGIAGIAHNMLMVKQKIENWPAIKQRGHSSTAHAQAETIVEQLNELAKQIKKFNDEVNLTQYEGKDVGGLPKEKVNDVIKQVYKEYETVTKKIFKEPSLDSFITNRHDILHTEALGKSPDFNAINRRVGNELAPLVIPLRTLAKEEKHQPTKLEYEKRIKTIDNNIKAIHKQTQPAKK